jgi:homoserine/homoserine lactone efflux protein
MIPVGFLITTTVASLTPGPAVMLVLAQSLGSGLGLALRAVLGIVLGSCVYLGVAAFGLLAVLSRQLGALAVLQLAGAGYLCWIGVVTLTAALRATPPHPIPLRALRAGGSPVATGLVTQVANPKALLYWTALLPPFLDSGRPLLAQLAVMAATGMAVDVVVLSGHALVADRVRAWLGRAAILRRWQAVSGCVFLACGVWLAARIFV